LLFIIAVISYSYLITAVLEMMLTILVNTIC